MDATPEYSLASLQQVKQRINIALDNAEYDDALLAFSKLATQMIEGALELSFKQQSFTEYLDTPKNYTYQSNLGGAAYGAADLYKVRPFRVRLQGYPLPDDPGFEARLDYDRAWATESILDAQYYSMNAESGRVVFDYGFEQCHRALKLTYTAGYALDYEAVPYLSDRETELLDDCNVSSQFLVASEDVVERLVDGAADKSAADGATLAAATAYVQWSFPVARVVAGARWTCPNDKTTHDNGATAMSAPTLTLVGSVLGDFTDAVTIATEVYTGVQTGDELALTAGEQVTAYKAYRLTCSQNTATAVYCAQVGLQLKDTDRAYLRNVPSRLHMACALLTKFLWSKDRTGAIGMSSGAERRNAVYSQVGAMPPEVQQMLAPYRRLKMAG